MVKPVVNGTAHEMNLPGDMPLLWVLHDEIGLAGTEFGSGIAQRGACTLHVEGVPALACVTPPTRASGPRSGWRPASTPLTKWADPMRTRRQMLFTAGPSAAGALLLGCSLPKDEKSPPPG